MNYYSFDDRCQPCEKQLGGCAFFDAPNAHENMRKFARVQYVLCGFPVVQSPGFRPPRLIRALKNSSRPSGKRWKRRRKDEFGVADDVSRRNLLKWRGLTSAATKQ